MIVIHIDSPNRVLNHIELPSAFRYLQDQHNVKSVAYDISTRKRFNEFADEIIELIRKIEEEVKEKHVFLINIDLTPTRGGIELFTWLRIKKIYDHCILYSYSSSLQLACADPHNLILFTKGLTLISPGSNPPTNLEALAGDLATEKNLRAYLPAAFKVGEFRHKAANWWGVKQLIDLHSKYSRQPPIYPKKIQEELGKLENAVADYLYSPVLTVPPEWVTKIHESYRGFESQWNTQNRVKKKVLLIDDQASEGWQGTYRLLFDKYLEFAEPIVPIRGESLEDLFGRLTKEIAHHRPDLLLLDLRLLDNEDSSNSIDVQDLSGAQLLAKLRQSFRGLPVLMTTASNKIWTFEKVIGLGADAYYIKQGVDEGRSAQHAAENYVNLVRLMQLLVSDEYEMLRKFDQYAKSFQKRKEIRQVWRPGDRFEPRNAEIQTMLDDSVILFKSWLHGYHLGYGFGEKTAAFMMSALIVKLAGVFELIHGMPDTLRGKKFDEFQDLVWARNDRKKDNLRWLRNDFSHSTYNTASFKVFKTAFKEFETYMANFYGPPN